MSTACVIVIGNEILSGRTQDTNLAWLAVEMNKAGVRLREARVVPDVPAAIVRAVNECRTEYDYIFTTGGIGPTHDDITSECIALAFGVPCERNEEAYQLLFRYYGADKLNEARLRMCNMPRGARLIPNPVSIAPGYALENVHVMAGVPRIMQAMFDYIRPALKGGKPMQSETVSVFLTEGTIARALTEVQERFADIEIGSYPFVRDGRLGTSLVARGDDESRLQMAKDAIVQMVKGFNGELAGESQGPSVPM